MWPHHIVVQNFVNLCSSQRVISQKNLSNTLKPYTLSPYRLCPVRQTIFCMATGRAAAPQTAESDLLLAQREEAKGRARRRSAKTNTSHFVWAECIYSGAPLSGCFCASFFHCVHSDVSAGLSWGSEQGSHCYIVGQQLSVTGESVLIFLLLPSSEAYFGLRCFCCWKRAARAFVSHWRRLTFASACQSEFHVSEAE